MDQASIAHFVNLDETNKNMKKFQTIFIEMGDPYQKKSNFFVQPSMKIHTPIESPSRIDKAYDVFKNVYFDFWPKKA